MADSGWSKDDYRRAFWESTRIPLSVWPSAYRNAGLLAKHLGPVTEDSLIPVTAKPDHIQIVIAGGDGKHSHYFGPFPGSFPVSRLIDG